ncbi:MAG TPA: hypothetical protein VFS88_02680, partial [Micavibrio sp.]|nr:hypothetical protein [Micavibrio sp.]
MDCRVAALLAMTFLMPAQPVQAQDAGYAPPPMFEDMTPPMVRPQGQDGYIVTPKASTNTQLPEPTLGRPPAVVPRVSVDPDAVRSAPAPAPSPAPAAATPAPSVPKSPKTPVVPAAPAAPVPPPKMKPVVEETYIKRDAPMKKPEPPKKRSEEPRTEAIGKPAPTPAPSRPAAPAVPSKKPAGDTKAPSPPSVEAPSAAPAKRDPHVSAIQGPKTMPALPAGNVEQQVTFEAAPETPETIMERHRKEAQAKRAGQPTLTPIVPAPNPNVQPAEFDRGGQDVLKKIIPFQPGQISLRSADADPIVAGVVKELDREEMKDWRVQIKAYATPHGTGLSSDRRIALSRALSLRSTMITQGVPANKID